MCGGLEVRAGADVNDNFNTAPAFTCQQCASEVVKEDATALQTHGTLIVCPAVLLAQWESEIRRHARELKVREVELVCGVWCVVCGERE